MPLGAVGPTIRFAMRGIGSNALEEIAFLNLIRSLTPLASCKAGVCFNMRPVYQAKELKFRNFALGVYRANLLNLLLPVSQDARDQLLTQG